MLPLVLSFKVLRPCQPAQASDLSCSPSNTASQQLADPDILSCTGANQECVSFQSYLGLSRDCRLNREMWVLRGNLGGSVLIAFE